MGLGDTERLQVWNRSAGGPTLPLHPTIHDGEGEDV